MKLRLHWTERFEMVREYPPFELDSEKFPELELEMLQVYNAGSANAQQEALSHLEYKMNHTQHRGETIMKLMGPSAKPESAQLYPIGEQEGSLLLTAEED
jgi:hypothetical protein